MSEFYILETFDFKGDSFDVLELFKEEPFVFLLDSSLRHNADGRYSFVGFDPFEIFSDKGKNSMGELKKRFWSYKKNFGRIPTPLPCGAVGYFGYDFGLTLEKIRLQATDDLCLPDCFFGFYDAVITLDHLENKLHVFSTGLPEKRASLRKARAHERVKKIITALSRNSFEKRRPVNRIARFLSEQAFVQHFQSNFTKEEYFKAVRKALNYIADGDIYQVNLSQRFALSLPAHRVIDRYGIFKSLREVSPSSFGGYMDCGDFQILSSSPERFLRLQDGIVQTRPMKGTRSRGNNLQEDRRLKKELLLSKKDQAELLMITDLERNDLGRVCRYGSVKVKEMRALEQYATVFQTTSLVEGFLENGRDCFDLILACFPGGSITGCPKIRAMEIIEELEPTRRAVYTGSLGYMGFEGSMDFNILIRTLLLRKKKIYFHVGGGIVSDSSPSLEYHETLVKANAMAQSLQESLCLK